MIICESINVVIERVQGRRRDYAGLPHGTTQRELQSSCQTVVVGGLAYLGKSISWPSPPLPPRCVYFQAQGSLAEGS
jgi:hypothetical protein